MSKIEGEFVVLKDFIGYEDFVWLAKSEGWKKLKTYAGEGPTEPFDEIWVTDGEENVIHYVDEPTMAHKYLWVRGVDLKDIMFKIFSHLPAPEPEEFLRIAASTGDHDDAVDALFGAAISFPNFDPRALQVFEGYTRVEHPLLRQAALQAMAFRMWEESYPAIQRVAAEDEDEEVRKFAETILEEVSPSGE